jgi:hypothetical protein
MATGLSAPRRRAGELQADHFQLLGRVDRRIVTSGQAQLQLDAQTMALDGKFSIDEGLIDFTRSDAPQLSGDVMVVRRSGPEPAEEEAGTPTANPAPGHTIKLDLDVSLGEQLRLKGRAWTPDCVVSCTSPPRKPSRAERHGAGRQRHLRRLRAEARRRTRPHLFNGPAENPRLDIRRHVRTGTCASACW